MSFLPGKQAGSEPFLSMGVSISIPEILVSFFFFFLIRMSIMLLGLLQEHTKTTKVLMILSYRILIWL